MDYKAVLELMKEMNQTDLTRLEIEEAGVRILIEQGKNMQEVRNIAEVSATGIASNTSRTIHTSGQILTEIQDHIEPLQDQGNIVTSPMVGTYYDKPAPDQPAFVKVGDKVKKGQTLCIIEAMKLMNEIDSEYDGVITEVLVRNEQMVEFGLPLYRIAEK